jgi:hypothetical protein
MNGMSPSSGTLLTSSRSSCVKMPPITTVPPFSTSTWVLTCLVLMAGPAFGVLRHAVLVDVDVQDHVAFGRDLRRDLQRRLALRNWIEVAPLEVATW